MIVQELSSLGRGLRSLRAFVIIISLNESGSSTGCPTFKSVTAAFGPLSNPFTFFKGDVRPPETPPPTPTPF